MSAKISPFHMTLLSSALLNACACFVDGLFIVRPRSMLSALYMRLPLCAISLYLLSLLSVIFLGPVDFTGGGRQHSFYLI